MFYSAESTYLFEEDSGVSQITQKQGGEQGDALMPLLYCIALAPVLRQVEVELNARGIRHKLYAYLDDIYIWVEDRDKAREAHDLLRERMREGIGVDVNEGKTKLWGKKAGAAGGLGGSTRRVVS